jgi:hypothetical protein
MEDIFLNSLKNISKNTSFSLKYNENNKKPNYNNKKMTTSKFFDFYDKSNIKNKHNMDIEELKNIFTSLDYTEQDYNEKKYSKKEVLELIKQNINYKSQKSINNTIKVKKKPKKIKNSEKTYTKEEVFKMFQKFKK